MQNQCGIMDFVEHPVLILQITFIPLVMINANPELTWFCFPPNDNMDDEAVN